MSINITLLLQPLLSLSRIPLLCFSASLCAFFIHPPLSLSQMVSATSVIAWSISLHFTLLKFRFLSVTLVKNLGLSLSISLLPSFAGAQEKMGNQELVATKKRNGLVWLKLSSLTLFAPLSLVAVTPSPFATMAR